MTKSQNCCCSSECHCGENCQCTEDNKCCPECTCYEHKNNSTNNHSSDTDEHPNHMEDMPRLNRISGQIEGIKKMIEEGRYCPEIISQLRAVRSAVKAVESNILQKHLQNCVAQSFASAEDKDKKIAELKMLFDRFDD